MRKPSFCSITVDVGEKRTDPNHIAVARQVHFGQFRPRWNRYPAKGLCAKPRAVNISVKEEDLCIGNPARRYRPTRPWPLGKSRTCRTDVGWGRRPRTRRTTFKPPSPTFQYQSGPELNMWSRGSICLLTVSMADWERPWITLDTRVFSLAKDIVFPRQRGASTVYFTSDTKLYTLLAAALARLVSAQ